MADNETPQEPSAASTGDQADQTDQTDQTTTDETTEAPVAEPVAAPVAAQDAPRARLRDRAFSFRAMLAVGVATLLIGGAGGAAIVAATDGDHDGRRMSRFADGPGRDGFGPGGPGQNGFRNGPGGGFPGGPGQYGPDRQVQPPKGPQQDQQDESGGSSNS